MLNKNKIFNILKSSYPDPQSELNFTNSFQLIIAVVLSAQCTDKKVNQVTPILFEKFDSFQTLAKAKISEIEKIIKPINYYKTKSKNLVNLAKLVTSEYQDQLPKTINELIKLPGVGRKTASVVLGELGYANTLPVDTHVFRLAHRLAWSQGKNVLIVEQDLKQLFPAKLWRTLHHLLILHGRRVCKASNPNCEACEINKFCAKNI